MSSPETQRLLHQIPEALEIDRKLGPLKVILKMALSPLCLPETNLCHNAGKDTPIYIMLNGICRDKTPEEAAFFISRISQRFSVNVPDIGLDPVEQFQSDPEEWANVDLRLTIVEFFMTFGDVEKARGALENFFSSVESIPENETAIEIIGHVCDTGKVSVGDLSKIKEIATKFDRPKYFDDFQKEYTNPQADGAFPKGDRNKIDYTNKAMIDLLTSPFYHIPQPRRKCKLLAKAIIILILCCIVPLCGIITTSVLLEKSASLVHEANLSLTVSINANQTLLLTSYNSSAYSIDVSLDIIDSNYGPITAIVYKSPSLPKQIIQHLQQHFISGLSGRSPAARYNFNYNDGTDIPLFLQNGSIIKYSLDLDFQTDCGNEATSDSCTSLFIFDNSNDYRDFLNMKSSISLAESDCAINGSLSWDFHINYTSQYYVAIQIEGCYVVTGNASATRASYDNSGLSAACEPLTASTQSCSINLCTSFYGHCPETDGHILVSVTAGSTRLSHIYKYQKFNRVAKILITSFLSISFLIIVIIGFIFCIVWSKCLKKSN